MNRALAAAFLTACIVVGITLSLARTPLSRPAPEARRPADLPRERPVEPKPPRDRPVEPEPEPAPGPHDPRRPDTPPIERDRHEKATESYRRYLVVPAGVEEAAAELGASEAAVLDAFMAEWQIYAAAQQPSPIKDEAVAAAVRALAVRGHDGYLAVVSLVRGNGTGPSYFELVRATWQPGWESDLLAVARDEPVSLSIHFPRLLRHYDPLQRGEMYITTEGGHCIARLQHELGTALITLRSEDGDLGLDDPLER